MKGMRLQTTINRRVFNSKREGRVEGRAANLLLLTEWLLNLVSTVALLSTIDGSLRVTSDLQARCLLLVRSELLSERLVESSRYRFVFWITNNHGYVSA